MSFKLTKKTKDLLRLNGTIDDIKKEFIKSAKKDLQEIIVEENIKRGTSPVKGEGRYTKYSDSYKDAIKGGRYKGESKKITPVNLTLSGKMLNSFKVESISSGIRMIFKDKKAKYHNELGAGKAKTIRKMLPLEGESFSTKVSKQILDLLVAAVDKIIAKF